MTKIYKRITLGDLVTALRALPEDALVQGFDTNIHSYRGYYERNALEPYTGGNPISAHEAASELENQIGKHIEGYKGGDYTVNADELVYYAGYGSSGPAFIGLELDADNYAYAPVVLGEDYHF